MKQVESQMIKIPAGNIELRDDRTKHIWRVEINVFLHSRFPVTQDLYFEAMKERPSTFKGEKLPVETVTWKDAVDFCNCLYELNNLNPCYLISEVNEEFSFNRNSNGYRLPTEAEWQYACQAGTKKIRYREIYDIAWFKGKFEKNQTQEVDMKNRMNGGFMICWEMYGNGAQIYMMKMCMVPIGCSEVGAGVMKKEAL